MSINTNCNSYRKWAIGNDVRTILMANSAITSMVGTKIFPLVAPENTDGDFIIYGREKYSKNYTKMGVYEDDCTIFTTIVSDNYDTAVSLASAIDLALVGQHTLNNNNIIEVSLDDSTETFDDNKYIETLLFKIK